MSRTALALPKIMPGCTRTAQCNEARDEVMTRTTELFEARVEVETRTRERGKASFYVEGHT